MGASKFNHTAFCSMTLLWTQHLSYHTKSSLEVIVTYSLLKELSNFYHQLLANV